MKTQELIDGKHWLLIASYSPTAEVYEVVESNKDPLEDENCRSNYAELIEDCYNEYSYDEPLEEEDYIDALNEIELTSKKITPELIEEYGEDWYGFK